MGLPIRSLCFLDNQRLAATVVTQAPGAPALPTRSQPSAASRFRLHVLLFEAGTGKVLGTPTWPSNTRYAWVGAAIPVFFNSALNPLMFAAYQEFYGGPFITFTPGECLHPSGSLLYQPFILGPNGGVDIFDTHEGTLRRRVYFSEPPRSAYNALEGDFLAIGENGEKLFALTKSGLSVIDLAVVPLSIGSLSPSSGPASGGTAVTIRGSGFVQGAVVSVDGTSLPTTFVDQNTLQFATPSMSSGGKQITVANPDGRKYLLEDGFTYN